MNPVAVVAITPGGLALARRIAEALGSGEVHGLARRCAGADVPFDDTVGHLAHLFAEGRAIVAVCAAGIVIRALAPLLADKASEPPVLAVGEDGAHVVPLTGGHRGANRLAREIAAAIGGVAAITTASDGALGIALDDPPAGYELANPEAVKDFARRLIAGEAVRIEGAAPWLAGAGLREEPDAALAITVSERIVAGTARRIVYHPAVLAVGVGAERGADPEAAVALVRATLEEAGLAAQSVALVASLDLKENEPAIHSVSETLARPARFFTAATLEAETPRLANPSQAVFRAVGCHGVAEAAALAGAGVGGALVAEKRVGARVTCAVARAPAPIDVVATGRARGILAIVGLGPGDTRWRSGEAGALVGAASDVVGYGRYLDLVGPLRPGQRAHRFALGDEARRVARALDLAAEGRQVALVSSGDAGIYGMAALAFEMIEAGSAEWLRVAVTVAPGISALQAAAARAGAPLGHDFCAISLSDLMTPADVIVRRIEAAAAADFVVALYNPASGRRRALIRRALEILARHRAGETPVVLARELGRPDERVEITRLDAFDADRVDMLSVVLVGSTATRSFARGDGTSAVYTPRGYAVEAGSCARRGRAP
jgi:cobalt-precorrin 5A hydrolase/precorrin-3B C17-methyltransferase